MSNATIAQKYVTNPRNTWDGTEKIPLDVGGSDGVGLASTLAAYVLTSPTITGHATIEGATLTGKTGSGNLVLATSPALTTPDIGTPSAGTLTSCTGLPAAGVVGTAAILGANTFTGLQTLTGNLVISGAQSAAAWTTTGISLVQAAATYTDTSSSGTVAAVYINRLGIPTLAASSATTFTNAYGTWFEPPAAGTNVTLTKSWAAGFNGGIVVGAFANGLHFNPAADSLFEFYGSGSRGSYIQAGTGGILIVAESGAADIQLRATAQGIVLGNGTNSVRITMPAASTLSFAGEIVTVASSTSRAGLNLPSGTAPTSPVNGDLWYDGTNLMVRLGGVTKTITAV